MTLFDDLLRTFILIVATGGSLSGGGGGAQLNGGEGGRQCSFSPEQRSLNCSLPSLTAIVGDGGSFLDAFPAAATARIIRIRCEGWHGWEEGWGDDGGGGGWKEEGLGGRLQEEKDGSIGGRPFSGLGGLERLQLEDCR
jgi:hypothetical protein